MRKRQWIFINSMIAMLLMSIGASAQYSDYQGGYDYNDQVIIINDYDDHGHYRNDRRTSKRNNSRIMQERRWKEKMLRSAYRIAEADGRVTRREVREIQQLERELGICRTNHNNRQRRGRG